MYPEIMFIQSGYMLTHRQQLNKKNSKRLFGNLIESFRRDFKGDKKIAEKIFLFSFKLKKSI